MLLDVLHRLAESIERLCRLGVQTDVAAEIQLRCLLRGFYHYGRTFRLPHESQHLGVSVLAEYHNLLPALRVIVIFTLDALLKMEHHGTGSIDEFQVVLGSTLVGGRGFSVGTQKHLGLMELVKTGMLYSDEPQLLKPAALLAIVYNISQAIQTIASLQLLFCHADGTCHAETESGTFVNLDFHSTPPLSRSSCSWPAQAAMPSVR